MTPDQIAHYCFEKIIAQSKRPLLVAITGDSGSGKSYYSHLIRELFTEHSLQFTYVDHDLFLIPRADREPLKQKYYENGEFAGKSYWEILENWFYLDAFEQVIKDLREGRETTFHPYRRETGQLDPQPLTLPPNNFVIFDTTMQTEKMDFVVVVDVTQENSIKRKMERDKDLRSAEQIIEMHQKVQGYCWQRTRPTNADIVIDNNDFERPFIVKE